MGAKPLSKRKEGKMMRWASRCLRLAWLRVYWRASIHVWAWKRQCRCWAHVSVKIAGRRLERETFGKRGRGVEDRVVTLT